jgi:hypothetical protein
VIALLALIVGVCALNADGVPVCRRDAAVVETAAPDAPAWIVDAMRSGTACTLGEDIYATVPGDAEDWYAWREAHPDARIVERVQSADASIPDAWLFYADGEYAVFVFQQKLADVRGGVVIVHGECARLIAA